MPSFSYQRIWARTVLVICASIVVYLSTNKEKETVFASQKDVFERRGLNFPCSESYKSELSKFRGT